MKGMTIHINLDGSKMEIHGDFNTVKAGLIKHGGLVQESRTAENGEDVFVNGKPVSVLLFDGETEKKLFEL